MHDHIFVVCLITHKIQTRTIEAQKLERQLSDLINQAYGLTPEEIDLMWKTAPPRMPIPNPLLE